MWLHEGKEFTDPEKYYGFVYKITNLLNNRTYIGRKFFTKASTKQKNKKVKKIRVESDWQTYYGSSEELLKDVKEFGTENFKREILRLCKTLGETKYWETKIQFENGVLEKRFANGMFEFYNSNIMMKFTRRNIGEF